MKNKLKALASKRLHKGTKNSKAMLQEDSNKIIDNEPSTTSTNEDDCSGQESSALDILVSKLDNFEQQFKNFQAKTDNDIHILFAKLEMNTDNEKEREIDRLREENCKLKSDNANLIERLNGHANIPKDLSNKLKARFKRRILHAPNAIQTMHNEEAYLIIYCLNCIRCMQNSTFETGLRLLKMKKLVY